MKNEKRKAKKKGERKGKEERAEMACSINNTRRGSGIEGEGGNGPKRSAAPTFFKRLVLQPAVSGNLIS